MDIMGIPNSFGMSSIQIRSGTNLTAIQNPRGARDRNDASEVFANGVIVNIY